MPLIYRCDADAARTARIDIDIAIAQFPCLEHQGNHGIGRQARDHR
jgi:hypothetical protein